MGLEERITTSFQRIARGRSLVRAQSLSAAPRAKKWARNQKILIFLAAEFFRKIIEKSWCHRAGTVLKYTPDTVSRSQHCSFRKVYALKAPNRKVWCVRRNLRRMSNFCRHIQCHIQWNGLRFKDNINKYIHIQYWYDSILISYVYYMVRVCVHTYTVLLYEYVIHITWSECVCVHVRSSDSVALGVWNY